jgi:hypothetical protein
MLTCPSVADMTWEGAVVVVVVVATGMQEQE